MGDLICCRAQTHQMGSDTTQSRHRNVTPNVPAQRALTRTVVMSASTKPLALNPVPLVIPGGYTVILQVRGTSWKTAAPSKEQSQNSLQRYLLPPSFSPSPKQFRPSARSFVPSVPTNYRPSLGHIRSMKSGRTTLPGSPSHLSPYSPLSYFPVSRATPMLRSRPWGLSGFRFPMQLRGNWT